jgi:hypothetical protein
MRNGLGSALVPSAGDRILRSRTFPSDRHRFRSGIEWEVRRRRMRRPARWKRALPSGIIDPSYKPITDRVSLWTGTTTPGYNPRQGLGIGVGRGLGVGWDRGVGVGLIVAVGVAVGVTVAVGVAVGVAVAVGVGDAPPLGDTRTK